MSAQPDTHAHPHSHSHGHHHHHVDPEAGDRAVLSAVAINVLLTVVEFVGGLLSGSVALMADAVHNLSDAASLGLAWGARKIARRGRDDHMTFGYRRAEMVAALINLTTLMVIGLFLLVEAAERFITPGEVVGWLMIAVSGVALVVDGLTAWLTYRLSKDSVNIRAAFLHNVADALGSLAVILGGGLIVVFGWLWVDPLITVLIAGYILWMAQREMRGVIRMLMLGTPPGVAPGAVCAAMEAEAGVLSVHHLHIWQISEQVNSLEAHVVIEGEVGVVKARLKTLLAARFGITHVTLDTETPEAVCEAAPQIGS